ncbi:glycosyltransferase [Bacteriovorax sp. Seq25_V]|uniref:glycosyltransferase n=1 Tax=Bacteriovorax sp. Seq25_V TaxID=1201288 RepID=UPI000389E967|nr:glycosyltransferase [Bacteriovorax sp. Seq25_V]EQC44817.1 glycosyltransferases group 1 [Bacteriovorax sp. Seq25_V]
MKIVFYHHAPLPVKTYGGTERIMFWHMKELASLGHQVILLGHPESNVKEYGIKLIPLDKSIIRNGWEKLIPRDADIIHLQISYQIPKEIIDIPQVCTIHGNGQPGEIFHKNAVFVSKAHAKLHSSESFVYNAIDFDEYPRPKHLHKSSENLLFLAKASWSVKNLKDCKTAAINSKKHLHIAGGRSFSFSKYIHNHGLIGGEEKLKLIRKCDALLFPVRWHEPFGLAMIESMSQGLPVIGSQYGSLPEVIGPAGIACKNRQDFLEAVNDFNFSLSAKQIIEYAQSKFAISGYTKSYLKLYEKVISGQSLNESNPFYSLEKRAEELLPF